MAVVKTLCNIGDVGHAGLPRASSLRGGLLKTISTYSVDAPYIPMPEDRDFMALLIKVAGHLLPRRCPANLSYQTKPIATP